MTLQSHSWACIWRKTWSIKIHASVCTEALFTGAKIWNQPKCQSTEGWIKKMWPHIPGNITQPLEGVKWWHSQQHAQAQRSPHWVWKTGGLSQHIPSTWTLERSDMDELTDKTERPTDLTEQTYSYLYTLLYLRWIAKKYLLYKTRNSVQYYAAAWMGEESGEEQAYVCLWLSPSAVHLKLPQHC